MILIMIKHEDFYVWMIFFQLRTQMMRNKICLHFGGVAACLPWSGEFWFILDCHGPKRDTLFTICTNGKQGTEGALSKRVAKKKSMTDKKGQKQNVVCLFKRRHFDPSNKQTRFNQKTKEIHRENTYRQK